MRNSTRITAGAILALCSALLSSCASPAYQRTWQAARSAPPPPPQGCYEGTWRSEANGHYGKLRCIVSEADRGFKFHYQATWGTIFTGEFTIVCPIEKSIAGTWKVRGSKDLGSTFGGTFTHEATITSTAVEAHYSAKFDHGVMQLHRVQ
jgi:hypothetical protein